MPTDFWGLFWATILPNYIAAAGGLAATLLAIFSLVVSNRAKTTASDAIAADQVTRQRTADAIEEVARPLLASETLVPSETLLPQGDDEAATAEVDAMNRARLDAVLRRLRGEWPDTPDR